MLRRRSCFGPSLSAVLSAAVWAVFASGCPARAPAAPPPGSTKTATTDPCGGGALTAEGEKFIRRRPYLQQVTPHGALLLFTVVEGAEVRVRVTHVDGSSVGVFPAAVEPTEQLVGARQLRAQLKELAPGTAYCHRLEAGDAPLTAPAAFRTAPEPSAPVRFAVFGDSGTGSAGQLAVRHQLAKAAPDLVIHTGDVAYERGHLAEFEANFFGVYADLLQSVPFYPAPGNHDYLTYRAAPYYEVFALPENGSHERWYSFDWGLVHFVSLNTEELDPKQVAWLHADLEANRRPWVVAYLHQPPHSSGHYSGNERVRTELLPVLQTHRVPLLFAGHDHNYQRLHTHQGVTQVVTGGGGRVTYGIRKNPIQAVAVETHHFVLVNADATRIALEAIDSTGKVIDTWTTHRDVDEE